MKETLTTGRKLLPVENIINAAQRIKGVAYHTPFMHNINLSDRYQANIYLKREDLQVVRSYKLRGAYNKISSIEPEHLSNGVVCASAGNHAQGVAYACNKLGIKGYIFMPNPTPKQKIKQVQMFGKEHVHIEIIGDTFDDAYAKAMVFCKERDAQFIPPFDDEKIMEGQGTVGYEILLDTEVPLDYLILPIGGGGLSAGVGSYFKQVSPHTKIIGLEPAGAPAMKKSIEYGEVITLPKIDKFVDGAAVKRVGELTFEICRQVLDEVITVPEGKICETILKLYNEEAIVVEPAGAMSIAALDFFADEIKGKNVCCVVSGGNNDITRMEEIKERALLYNGLKHYFLIRFPQRAGALKEFVAEVLGPTDDITHFEYTKKNNREKGPAMVGIELQSADDYDGLVKRLEEHHIAFEVLNEKLDLFHFLI